MRPSKCPLPMATKFGQRSEMTRCAMRHRLIAAETKLKQLARSTALLVRGNPMNARRGHGQQRRGHWPKGQFHHSKIAGIILTATIIGDRCRDSCFGTRRWQRRAASSAAAFGYRC